MGAGPTADPRGGEFARDKDADVNDRLSDIISLAGVPGRLVEAKDCRDGVFAGTAGIVPATEEGDSAFGVLGMSRSIFEGRVAGESGVRALGVFGCDRAGD
jgi:hypothetical protein